MKKITPPTAPQHPIAINQCGYQRTDSYAWLKDEHWQDVLHNPKVLKKEIEAYLIEENTYTSEYLKETESLQKKLYSEMKQRIVSKDTSPKLEDGAWIYFSRFEENNEYKTYYRKSSDSLQEELLLDPNLNAKQFSYYKVGYIEHSPNHQFLAYAEDIQGSEIWNVQIKNLQTNQYLSHTIEQCTGDFTFSGCNQFVFWIYRDDHGRPTKIFRRDLASGNDTLIYTEKDPGFFLSIQRSLSNQWIFISAKDHDTSEVWLIPAHQATHSPICVMPRQQGIQYELNDWHGQFIIKTNIDQADNFKLMRMPIPSVTQLDTFHLNSTHWQTWVDHDPECYLMDMIAYQDYFVRLERYQVNTRIVITDQNNSETTLTGDEEAYTLSLDPILNHQTPWLRYSYQSPTTPRQWYRYHMATGEKEILKTQEIPSGHCPDDYKTKRLWAKATDGELVPITLTYHKNTALDGSASVLLYGYGSYGYAIDPVFSITALNYLNNGWIYAVAHIRGGSEKGWDWFLQGRKFLKINSFTDFISCAEHLIQQNYTKAGQIVADGRSAGGMLMGYIANERPDLFAGIIAVVPFVDVLNTMSDVSLPLTPPEWPEWGNPITDKKAYEYIASYSPYDNIKKQPYPAILAIGGLTDPRVTYWEPAKWIAKLRQYNTSNNPLLLKINMDTGHGGASGRYDSLKEAAFIQAFALSIVKSN
ncbi:S9 family peptidase [Commensalibacter sp. TBRC 16381]|uniref:S9 family peptidase n=2 Tax=Commensalibacter oyaizuii TaxID=3043873 RepID=A0ABT6PZW7_9PROT|nr:S9 family peptidase [Commensalibacter sp. TBRC 16381]MDI2090411.1 S9 family peptidase [Commensalibacter sp. TBRC 16381]